MNDPKNKPDVHDVANDQCNIDVGFLPVGVTHRPSAGIYKTANKVQSATDLPVRLYLGSLNVNTFHRSDDGWNVRYEDTDPDTFVTLEYRQAQTKNRHPENSGERRLTTLTGRKQPFAPNHKHAPFLSIKTKAPV